MKYIENFLNSTTMYRVVLYGLTFLFLISIIFSFLGLISDSPLSLILTWVVLVFSCAGLNYLFSKFVGAHANVESSYITAFILFFILAPQSDVKGVFILFLASFVAMASKYVFALYKKHIFNPVAISIVILGFLGIGSSIWWVATPYLFIPTAIVGYLVVKKVKRFSLFFSFVITSILILLLRDIYSNGFAWVYLLGNLKSVILSWPILFLGAIMLTEPTTTPPKRYLQVIYGIIVGVFFSIQFHFGFVYATPGLALIIGNLFAYIVSPKKRLMLILKEKKQLSPDIYEFSFTPDKKMDFLPGQYLEWTLDHKKPDTRGNRRYFTIASSPTENVLKLGIRFSPESSSFKKELLSIELGSSISASQLAGEFILPKDINKKMVFMAGGIGITPFRSMIKYLIDRKEKRDIVVFYSNKTLNSVVYKDIFDEAKEKLGIKFIYFITAEDATQENTNIQKGPINKDLIKKEIPDYLDRTFYISGPYGMVEAFKAELVEAGVSKGDIKTDLFPGFA